MEFCFSPGHLHNFFFLWNWNSCLANKTKQLQEFRVLMNLVSVLFDMWQKFNFPCFYSKSCHLCQEMSQIPSIFSTPHFSLFQSFVKLFKKNHISYEKIFVLNFDSWRLMWNSFFFESQALVTALCLYDGVNLLFPF